MVAKNRHMAKQIGFRKKRNILPNLFGLLLFVAIVIVGYYWILDDAEYEITEYGGKTKIDSSIQKNTLEDSVETSKSDDGVIDKVLPAPNKIDKKPQSATNDENETKKEINISNSNSTEELSVLSPKNNEYLTSPFTITGKSGALDDKIYIRITNSAGIPLIEEFTIARGREGEEWKNFRITINYQFTSTKEGYVEVYTKSTEGDEQSLVRIPVYFN